MVDAEPSHRKGRVSLEFSPPCGSPHSSDVESFVVSQDGPRYTIDESEYFEGNDETLNSWEGSQPVLGAVLDNLGLVHPTESYATEPPDDLVSFFLENSVSRDPDISDFATPMLDASSLDDISRGLLSLYQDYQRSILAFMAPPLLDPTSETFSEDAIPSVPEEYAMSKSQVQLTLDEGNIWHGLLQPSVLSSSVAEERSRLLAQRSNVISTSYEKRNNPPTLKTYGECKLILKTMGIPCIESAGPYEAEALAASLVHHGFADYVASEDTVRSCCPGSRP